MGNVDAKMAQSVLDDLFGNRQIVETEAEFWRHTGIVGAAFHAFELAFSSVQNRFRRTPQ